MASRSPTLNDFDAMSLAAWIRANGESWHSLLIAASASDFYGQLDNVTEVRNALQTLVRKYGTDWLFGLDTDALFVQADAAQRRMIARVVNEDKTAEGLRDE